MSCIDVLKRMRIEPFIFLFMFAYALEGLTITQLAQDKICLQKYHMNAQYCGQLSGEVSSDSEFNYKNQILADVTTFTLYKTLINTIPVIFWSLFLGGWADRHSRAPKILMSIVAILSCVESILLLVNAIYFELDEKLLLLAFIPLSMSGGLLSVMMSVYSYISATTEQQFRTIKFAILEALIFVAAPIGIYIGGTLIGKTISGVGGQLHHYQYVFGLGLGAKVLAAFWIIFIPFEKSIFHNKIVDKSVKRTDEMTGDSKIETTEELINSNEEREPLIRKTHAIGSTNREIKNMERVLNLSLSHHEISSQVINSSENNNLKIHSSLEENLIVMDRVVPQEDIHWYVMFKDLFDIQNIRDMYETCTKARSGGKRSEIWVLVMSLTLIALANNGALGIMFQFVQRVFEWNAEIFSIVNASTLLITALSVLIIVPLLIKVFKFTDMSLSIVGILSILLQNLIRGTILNANAFYMSYVFGSLSYVPAISVRSKLSTIVDQTEENKVFGLLATLETITPFVASIIYSTLFNATIAIYPGLVFQISAAILLIPFIGFVYIANYCE